MSALLDYPKQARYGRIFAKDKFYKHANITHKMRLKITEQVSRITMQYTLVPETINLPPQSNVEEIQIFELALKADKFDIDILRCIDKAIGVPIIFHLTYADRIKVIATYKRPSESDVSKWVISDEYFESGWMPANIERQKLPVVLNLASLYKHILRELIPLQSRDSESLEDHIERMEQVIAKDREHKKLEARMNKEKQFNRKVEMNAELRSLNNEIEQLKHGAKV